MFALFLTSSRGGLIALGVALIAAVILGGRRRGTMIVAALGAVMVTVFYFATIAPDSVRERVTHPEGGTGRVDIWTVGWRMVRDNTIEGVGSGNFTTASIHYLLEPGKLVRDDFIVDTPKVAHNTYLQVLAELGIVGFALFMTILLFSFVCAFKAHRVAAARRTTASWTSSPARPSWPWSRCSPPTSSSRATTASSSGCCWPSAR